MHESTVSHNWVWSYSNGPIPNSIETALCCSVKATVLFYDQVVESVENERKQINAQTLDTCIYVHNPNVHVKDTILITFPAVKNYVFYIYNVHTCM